ncbi:LOW QUALITY PROTEIN: hypothetical protein PanWU01x14_172680, partial [Parasponia andersonii]
DKGIHYLPKLYEPKSRRFSPLVYHKLFMCQNRQKDLESKVSMLFFTHITIQQSFLFTLCGKLAGYALGAIMIADK